MQATRPLAQVTVVRMAQDLGDRVVVDRGAVELGAKCIERPVDLRLESNNRVAGGVGDLMWTHPIPEQLDGTRRGSAGIERREQLTITECIA